MTGLKQDVRVRPSARLALFVPGRPPCPLAETAARCGDADQSYMTADGRSFSGHDARPLEGDPLRDRSRHPADDVT